METLTERREAFAAKVARRYSRAYPQSQALFLRGRRFFPNQVAQNGRMVSPFPPFVDGADGVILTTADGHQLVDLWAGHFCMVFGHRPAIPPGEGSLYRQLGMLTALEADVAEGVLRATGDDQILFSTSGALATQYSTMIAAAATGRNKLLKVEGGWHGVQPWALSGVRKPTSADFQASSECGGVPSWFDENVLVVPFNDCAKLETVFSRYGDQLAAFILELVLGNAGMEMATPEFATTARDLCNKHGALLIIDELVTGFRVRAGGLQTLYGIQADLSTYGKALTGGMPFACITGRRSVMAAVSSRDLRATVDAGTFTAHPGVLMEVKENLRRFHRDEATLFPDLLGRALRLKTAVAQVFSERKMAVHVTGTSTLDVLPVFPIGTLRFTVNSGLGQELSPAQAHWDSRATAVSFRNDTARLALILRGIYAWQGLGVVTAAHDDEMLDRIIHAYESFADEIVDLFPMETS